jgi:hypothetical protein
MRTILFSLLFTTLFTQAQITLEHTYPVQTLPVVKLQWHGYKYALIDTQISLYNMDHTLYKRIAIPVQSTYDMHVEYLTEGLFNLDTSNIEYLLIWNTTQGGAYTAQVYEEDGTMLFSKSNVSTWYVMPNDPSPFPIFTPIYNTANGTKMQLSEGGLFTPASTYIYSLPGSLECIQCNSGGMTGLLNPTIDNGFLSGFPNPSGEKAEINYRLPDEASKGTIVLYNSEGNEVKRYEVDKTFTSLTLPVSELSSGTYFYSLEVRGKRTSAKKMIVVH